MLRFVAVPYTVCTEDFQDLHSLLVYGNFMQIYTLDTCHGRNRYLQGIILACHAKE
jgi:hypothetical protein